MIDAAGAVATAEGVVAGIPATTWRSDDGTWSMIGSFPELTTGISVVQFTPRP